LKQRNQLDGLIYGMEKLLEENKEKITEADATPIREALAEGRKALESKDTEKIRAAVDDINRKSHKLAEMMYQQAGQSAAGGGGGGAARRARQAAARAATTSSTRSSRKISS